MIGTVNRRTGLSLIELLVVVALVAALVGMLVAVIKPKPKIERTRAILASLRMAFDQASAQTGFQLSPAEHPFAGSRSPRSPFVRADGGPCDTAGEAITGIDPSLVDATARTRVLLPDDRFADAGLPLLFGLRRDEIGVVGSMQKATTKRRRLARPAGGGALAPPYDDVHYPGTLEPSDAADADPNYGTPAANKQAFDYLFGASAAQGELVALGALFATPDPHGAFVHPLRLRRVVSSNLPIAFTDAATDADGQPRWQPGYVRDGTLPDGRPSWKHYKLPGLAVYDAWGVEVLCSGASANVRLRSAGEDGVFRWQPGQDRQLQTSPIATVAAGDDGDGAKDDLEH